MVPRDHWDSGIDLLFASFEQHRLRDEDVFEELGRNCVAISEQDI